MGSLVLYLAVYIGLLFLVSWRVSRKQDTEEFLIAGRNRAGWQILASKFAAAIGAGYFITYTGFAYEYGIGVFAILLGIVVGYLIFAYWAAPKIALHSRAGRFYTIGHFVLSRLNNHKAQYVSDILASVILFGWLLVGIVGSGKIIADFGLLSYPWAVILTSAVVLGYLWLAGYRAVILTDVVQSMILLILMLIVTFGIIGQGQFSFASLGAGSVGLTDAIGFFLFGVLATFSYSDRYQLAYAAKDESSLKHGMGLAVIPILIVASLLLIIGVFMADHAPGIDTGLVFTEALKNFLSPELVPIAIVLFFAGVMSSADTNIYAISSHYALSVGNGDYIQILRRAMLGLTGSVAIIALAFSDIVDVSILAGAVSLTLSWAMIYLLAGGTSSSRFLGSVVGAVAGLVLGIVFIGLDPALALPIVVCGALGLLYKGRGAHSHSRGLQTG